MFSRTKVQIFFETTKLYVLFFVHLCNIKQKIKLKPRIHRG